MATKEEAVTEGALRAAAGVATEEMATATAVTMAMVMVAEVANAAKETVGAAKAAG